MGHRMLEEGRNKEYKEKLQLKRMPNTDQPFLPWKKSDNLRYLYIYNSKTSEIKYRLIETIGFSSTQVQWHAKNKKNNKFSAL